MGVGQHILAIDPGRYTGWARFRYGVLVGCGLIEPYKTPIPTSLFTDTHLVIIEQPQIYPHQKKRVDPNDIVKLAMLVGQYEMLAKQAGCMVEKVLPATWKKQTPKNIHNRRVMAKLSDAERRVLAAVTCPKRLQNNVIDACGLGLWRVGRDANL